MVSREKKYMETINKNGILNNVSKFSAIPKGDDKNFEGLGKDNVEVKQYDTFIANKLDSITKFKDVELNSNYSTNDLIIPIVSNTK